MSNQLTVVGIYRNKLCIWNNASRNILEFPIDSIDKWDIEDVPVFNTWKELENAAVGYPADSE